MNNFDLLKFILECSEVHKVSSNLKYNNKNYCFEFDGSETDNKLPKLSGVYFLLSHNDSRVQKIGKAEGNQGLYQRFQNYTSKKNKGKLDRTSELWLKVMTDPNKLKGESLSVFYYITKPYNIKLPNISCFKLEAFWARSLEKHLSQIAKNHHDMFLSGQN